MACPILRWVLHRQLTAGSSDRSWRASTYTQVPNPEPPKNFRLCNGLDNLRLQRVYVYSSCRSHLQGVKSSLRGSRCQPHQRRTTFAWASRQAAFRSSAYHFGTYPWHTLFFCADLAWQDDGFELFESRAICRYLCMKYGKGSNLLPDLGDIAAVAKFEQAASIENNNFDPFASQLALETVIKPLVSYFPDHVREG